ncbi:hypothetical protein EUTSA_v10025080mg [Eutrema salsugineum]|uniref:DUF3741 domain-containing protein n=2 Tax=Eutrema salsugineum TaxID=72664 RepID=V4LVR0_EUTSA|nr:hypothetical protein EUTSA_v10025080mg [Eutrema salsugineum]
MGREWYNGGRSSKSNNKSSEAKGCITALYHFFQFHHFHFPSRNHHHQPSIDSPSRNPKDLVAPRNSLELTEQSPLSTNYKERDSLNIPVGGKRSKLGAILVDTSSDICNSPRTNTPNVVARLMGLDLLPDNLDLSRSSRNSVRGHRLSKNDSGTISLPESPRVSSARKSDSDIRRLSLQLNRENKHEEFGRWRLKELKQDEERRSPRHNGRHLVKQMKQRVITRRLGMDITNLLENRRAGAAQNQIEHRKVFSKKENTSSSNPTFVFKQDKISQRPRKVTLSQDSKENLKRVNEQTQRPINGFRKSDSEPKFYPHPTHNNRNKQRKAFISISTHSKPDHCDPLDMKKCKKIPKSNDIFNISVASSAVSATEIHRTQMKRAEEPERNADATICSGKTYKCEEKQKFPQETRNSNFCDSTTISATLSSVRGTEIDFEHLPVRKKLEEEEGRVVAEIERRIVDALVLETVKTAAFNGVKRGV